MSQNLFLTDRSGWGTTELNRPGRLSQNGQIIAISIYGSLLLAGFFFGLATGYAPTVRVPEARPELAPVARKEPEPVRPPAPKPAPKLQLKTDPRPEPQPQPQPQPQPESVPTPQPEPNPSVSLEPKRPSEPDPRPEPPPQPKLEPKIVPKKEQPVAVPSLSYEKDVKPILRSYCFNCHGAVGKPKGDVDLTSHAAIFDPKNAPTVVPGEPKRSALLLTIEDMSMPPQGPRPTKGEVEVIRNWILGGAKP